ncbi:MAG: hypothetical protein ACTSUE_10495 [Promethearchaeota archaeon]
MRRKRRKRRSKKSPPKEEEEDDNKEERSEIQIAQSEGVASDDGSSSTLSQIPLMQHNSGKKKKKKRGRRRREKTFVEEDDDEEEEDDEDDDERMRRRRRRKRDSHAKKRKRKKHEEEDEEEDDGTSIPDSLADSEDLRVGRRKKKKMTAIYENEFIGVKDKRRGRRRRMTARERHTRPLLQKQTDTDAGDEEEEEEEYDEMVEEHGNVSRNLERKIAAIYQSDKKRSKRLQSLVSKELTSYFNKLHSPIMKFVKNVAGATDKPINFYFSRPPEKLRAMLSGIAMMKEEKVMLLAYQDMFLPMLKMFEERYNEKSSQFLKKHLANARELERSLARSLKEGEGLRQKVGEQERKLGVLRGDVEKSKLDEPEERGEPEEKLELVMTEFTKKLEKLKEEQDRSNVEQERLKEELSRYISPGENEPYRKRQARTTGFPGTGREGFQGVQAGLFFDTADDDDTNVSVSSSITSDSQELFNNLRKILHDGGRNETEDKYLRHAAETMGTISAKIGETEGPQLFIGDPITGSGQSFQSMEEHIFGVVRNSLRNLSNRRHLDRMEVYGNYATTTDRIDRVMSPALTLQKGFALDEVKRLCDDKDDKITFEEIFKDPSVMIRFARLVGFYLNKEEFDSVTRERRGVFHAHKNRVSYKEEIDELKVWFSNIRFHQGKFISSSDPIFRPIRRRRRSGFTRPSTNPSILCAPSLGPEYFMKLRQMNTSGRGRMGYF